VRDRRLDAAIVVEPPDAIGKGEIFDRWVEEPLVMIAPAALASTDPIALLKRETLIRYDRRGWGGQLVDGWVSTNAPVARSRIELDALDGIEAMVAAGLGVAIVPDWQGRSRAVPGVVTIALPSAPVRQVGLFARRFSHRQELVELLTPTFRANGI
jgi:DNA-binding transcriptional LysR family regulator